VVFSSTIFLFLFLPLVLGLYFLVRPGLRNGVLLLASLTYYAWGESKFLRLVLFSILGNYLFGLTIQALRSPRLRQLVLACAVVTNIGLLVWFKYVNFLSQSLDDLLRLLHSKHDFQLAPVTLPLGISFFTFHALSYVVDIYRRDAVAQKNLPRLGLYILFFPQLIAGPIVRYHEICDQLEEREIDSLDLSLGIERFIVGLAKKMLIANSAAEIADAIFGLAGSDLTAPLAWLGVSAYAIQVYFDFSGYSDMAIGLARMFGFRFPENFNYPYVSQSMTEFWRRWHMSLSRWFRDYLYIPLGGNRSSGARTYFNLVTVFLLCGLWHGASWNFVIWGALHGLFLVIERLGLLRLLQRTWPPVRHAYCLSIILITWVFFRAPTLSVVEAFLRAMMGKGTGAGVLFRATNYLDHERLLALAAGVLGATPLVGWFRRFQLEPGRLRAALFDLGRLTALLALALASAMRLSSGTYNPFIYFRF